MGVGKIKICCFCEKWESGGIESFLNNVIRRLDLEKCQVDIVTACLAHSIFTKPLLSMGVRFFELSGRQRSVVHNHRQFFMLLRQERYHVVHLNLFQGLSLAYAETARRAGVPVRIAHSHNTALRKSATKPLKQTIHNAAKYIFAEASTDFWACSANAAEFLFSAGTLKKRGYRFIPNGIETERFRFDPGVRDQVRVELGLEDKFVIGNVGRLCFQKNQDFLLDIFAQVRSQRPNSCLLLVGEGDLLDSLKEKAQRIGITDSVNFYGSAPHVEQLLWAMDVFVLSSRFEGLPLTAIEAQVAGLPCFFSDAITQECSITDSSVFLPLMAGKEAWADAILACNTEGECRLSAGNPGEEMFSVDSVAEKIQGMYIKAVEVSGEEEPECQPRAKTSRL